MKNLLVFLSVMLLFAFSSCEKSILDNCAASSGPVVKENRGNHDIRYIHLSDNINLIIQYGNGNKLEVEAGENLLPFIKTEVNGHELYIRNENKCNWLRSYNKEVNVYLNISRLDSIDYYGSGDIKSLNAIAGDSLQINVWEGSGSIDLELDVFKSYLNLHFGTVDYHVRGRSDVTYIYAASYGPFYCSELSSNFVYINNSGSNDCYVRTSVSLDADIRYLGNIYYYGNPQTIHSEITGAGKLIHLQD